MDRSSSLTKLLKAEGNFLKWGAWRGWLEAQVQLSVHDSSCGWIRAQYRNNRLSGNWDFAPILAIDVTRVDLGELEGRRRPTTRPSVATTSNSFVGFILEATISAAHTVGGNGVSHKWRHRPPAVLSSHPDSQALPNFSNQHCNRSYAPNVPRIQPIVRFRFGIAMGRGNHETRDSCSTDTGVGILLLTATTLQRQLSSPVQAGRTVQETPNPSRRSD
jgi:hypothetical protein